MNPPISMATYKRWRRDYEGFSEKVDAIRSSVESPTFTGDFGWFRKRFFGFDTFAHQQTLIRACEETKPLHITLCLLPPEHGKTSVIEDYICYKLAQDPNHRFAVVSETDKHSKKIIGTCHRRMRPHATTDYTARYGPFYDEGQERSGKPWTTTHFTVFKADHDERDYSVAAAGWTSHVYGARWDTLILDDVQSRRSLNATEKMLRTIQQDFFSRVGEGQIIIIGTRVGVGDIYEKLIEAGLVDTVIRMPAHNGQNLEHFEFDDGRVTISIGDPLWPERWPKQMLARKAFISGTDTWACAYMQEPHSSALTTFTDDLVELAKDKDRSIGPLKEFVPVSLGLDPALGGGCAITAFGCTIDRLYLLDAQKDFNYSRTEEILALVETFARRFRPNKLIAERDSFQKGLVADQRLQAMAARLGFEVLPHTSSRNKSDEILGVASMATAFHTGEFRIPYGDELARRRMAQLLKELGDWRPNISGKLLEQDLVMACWFVWKNWMETRGELIPEIHREWRPSWMGGKVEEWKERLFGLAS